MLTLTNLVGFAGGGDSPVVLTAGSLANVAGATSMSASSMSFGGAPSSDRYAVVMIETANAITTVTHTAVTVAGVSCTRLAGSFGLHACCSIWVSNTPIPTGTTATVVLTNDTAPANGTFYLNSAINIQSPAAYSSGTARGTSLSTTVNVPEGGLVAAIAGFYNGSTSSTWTGVTKQGTDNVYNNAISTWAFGSPLAQNAYAVSVSWPNPDSTRDALAVAVLR